MAGSGGHGGRSIGIVTRGTTNTNRLRRVDRWIAALPELRGAADPLVVDLGFGASAVTSFELLARIGRVRADVEVIGLEIDPVRVRVANEQLAALQEARERGTSPTAPHAASDGLHVSFARGGFELPVPGSRRPVVIRAMNVLRQYDESAVVPAWRLLAGRLQDQGLAIDGTCDEIGRVCSWVALSPAGPRTLTLSLRLAQLDAPSIVAERLPKILIHRNVGGEAIHALLGELDSAWRTAAPLATFGPRQRWMSAVSRVKDAGWPVLDGPSRWRLGELTVPWRAIEPRGFAWPIARH